MAARQRTGRMRVVWSGILVASIAGPAAFGQVFDAPDRGQPGDETIQAFLRQQAERIDAKYLDGISTAGDWAKALPRLREEYFYMLGLWPLPEKTPLHAKVTRTLPRDGYAVEMVHFQSRPGLYVTGNLYRPAAVRAGERLPAVLYVCGHANGGRNGNKAPYQANGIWFGKHGYVCLVIDTLQRGEIESSHRGTYSEKRWWWHSRGYTPAGVECWNGVRAIDYLASRTDVDPQRIGVTGISGGGAATFWIAAADERVKVAAAVSGMADLESYVGNRTINGHCDCMFLYNVFEWPWTQIAALVAPRPLLFVNSDADRIFPMDANRRITNRLEWAWRLFGAGDRVDSVVSIGGHAYRQDIRQAVYRFLNTHLKGDPAVVTDSESDLVPEDRDAARSPIPFEQLRVWPTNADIPFNAVNRTIDETFVPMAEVTPPPAGQFDAWKKGLLAELTRVSLRCMAERPTPTLVANAAPLGLRLSAEPPVEFRLRWPNRKTVGEIRKHIVLAVIGEGDAPEPDWAKAGACDSGEVCYCDPRGIGETRWTTKGPPNYVARSMALLGRTVDDGRVRDAAACARHLRLRFTDEDRAPRVHVVGRGAAGVIGAYAALFEPGIDAVTVIDPPSSHMDAGAPQFLNVLRVCDVADALGMLAPRELRIVGGSESLRAKVKAIYAAAGAADRLTLGE